MKNREIKFRAWDIEFETMIYEFTKDGYSVDMQNGDLVVGSTDGNGDYFELELMRFTGLTDKNGKDIYEGDIIQERKDDGEKAKHFCIGSVTFKLGRFVINWKPEKDGQIFYSETLYCHNENSEVIGNIHKNPELL
jgi:uncharacterized phage protein (TIGR01671 family)